MGPISNIGPKTSWAARDRPEQNLEAKFCRCNNLSEIITGGRPHGGGGRHHVACGARPHACYTKCGAWRWDTASRGPTTIVAPESQLRTCPTDHGPKILKFQNRSKRARYHIPARKLQGLPGTGPNQTLEEISRHDIAGASPERRPAAAAPHEKSHRSRARRRAKRDALPCQKRRSAPSHRRNIIDQRAPASYSSFRPSQHRLGQRRIACATKCGQRTSSSPNQARPARFLFARHARPARGRRAPWIQLAVGPQPLWLRNHNSGLAHRIMVKRLATSPHDPLGITDSACKNQLVVVSVQYGPFNPYIPIRSTTIGKSRVSIDPIAMHTSWRSNSDIASVTSIGYPCMSANGESSTTLHRLLHASGSHPIPPPNDPKTNQYNQDLGLIHSTNGNHLESPNEGSSIDHQVTIYLHAQNITMFPTNETWYFASQILVSSSGGLILILTAQSTRN
ncbi:hypothetical protein F511_26692 [Dorcoceras hygrometricum]|uniref:Uncharacterized protein n=1 Tax=Dorcoceras hygrometricum TaxID=472368 RepID=A0A2Z7BXP3_9LAMI|nr:hypothetical protein F511_26692 [Dorcoceras hygrometricum]